MALLWMDGFDLYDNLADMQASIAVGNVTSTFVDYTPTGGRYGGGAVRLLAQNTANSSIIVPISPAVAQNSAVHVAGAYLYDQSTTIQSDLIAFYDSSGTIFCTLDVSPAGELVFVPQAGASTPTGYFLSSSWHWIEMRVVQGSTSSNGSVEIRLDEISILTLTGIDTNVAAGRTTSSVSFLSGTNGDGYWDDIFVFDTTGSDVNNFTGDCRIDTLRPNGNTAANDWTITGAATTYEAIDDPLGSSDGDTTYISTATVGHKSRVDVTDVSGVAVDTLGVQLRPKAKKTDAGAATFRGYLSSNSVEENGVTVGPNETYSWLRVGIYEDDPDSGLDWTDSSINAIQPGVERVT